MNARAFLVLLLSAASLRAIEPARVGISDSRALTLNDAVLMALKHNLDIEEGRTNVSAARAAEQGAHGIYDPAFRWNPQFQVLNTPSPSVLSGELGKLSEHDLTQTVGIHQRSWQGAIFDLSYEAGRVSTNNPFIGLNPYYTSQITLAFTQPLLRGRTIDPERALLKIRGVQTGIARTELELHAIDVVTRVEQAYWDLVAARDSAAVNREAADLARTQLEINRRMIAAGSLAAVELSASEAELQRRLDNFYASLDVITAAENNLKELLSPRRDDAIWNQELVPEASHIEAPGESADLSSALAHALKTRPELREVSQQQQVNAIEQQQNQDQVKPALNLVTSYTNAGLAGAARNTPDPFTAAIVPYATRINDLSTIAGVTPLPPSSIGSLAPYQSGGFGTSMSNLFAGHYQSVQAGLNFEWTPRNRQARANLEQSTLGARQLKIQRARAEQAIESQVRNAIQSLATARQRIAAAESGSRAAKEKLASEQRLFNTGESTNFLVLTRQNEYSDARQRLLAARLDFNKAVARFEQAVGKTLSARNLDLQ